MHAEIKHCPERKVVGLSATMKQNEHHKIPELWKRFMPRKREIGNQQTSGTNVQENQQNEQN